MGAFSYKALNEAGKTVKGFLEGDSERQVRSLLRAQKLKPLEVESVVGGGVSTSNQSGFSFFNNKNRHIKLSTRDLSLITRQLASLVRSGLPLDEALQATGKQAHKANIKQVVLQVRTKVLEGFSLAQAMGENPATFNDMYRALVRAGESAGYLSPVLERLAEYTQSSQRVQQKVKMAMVYPVILMTMSLLVITLLMAFVVPKLVHLFEKGKQQLPLITKIMINISHFVVHDGVFVVIGIFAAIVGVRSWLKQDANLRRWHAVQLKLPVIGELVRQTNTARFAATLSLLASSGVPLLQALTIAGQVMSNKVLQESSEQVVNAVREGTSLARAMESVGTFPPLLVQLVSSGETNGTLPQQLKNAADDQERDLESVISMAMSILEPATIVFMGISVGLIVMAILLPIFQMNSMI